MKQEAILSAAILTMLATATTQAVAAAQTSQEKCYGIVKAKMNDCGVKDKHGCAGVAPKDSMPEEWIFVPKGTCSKIVGGSLTPPAPEKKPPAAG